MLIKRLINAFIDMIYISDEEAETEDEDDEW